MEKKVAKHAESWVRPDIAAMEPYAPILPFEVVSQRLGRAVEDITKLDANENPYGPAPAVIEALKTEKWFHIYPDPESSALRAALSEHFEIPAERLLAGMGADELIDLVLRAILSAGDNVINCPPTFGMYPFSTAVNQGDVINVARLQDFAIDVAAIESAVLTNPMAKVLFICSPNNPDGSVISDDALRALLGLKILIVLDEAYIDFAEVNGHRSRLCWSQDYDNLVVLRTFSKLAGLAGLRVGFGAFPLWLMPHLWKIKQPYNVNVAASTAAIASLKEPSWMTEKVELIVSERERMISQLAGCTFLQPYKSQANFVLFRVIGRSAQQLKLDLAQEGILVRYFDKPGLENCIRISAGRPLDTDRLAAAIHRLS